MGYYFVLEKEDDCNNLLLEDLLNRKRMRVRRKVFDTLIRESKGESQILKILPSDFRLSPFTNGKLPYVTADNRMLLFNISDVMQSFKKDSEIEQNSIIEVSEWK